MTMIIRKTLAFLLVFLLSGITKAELVGVPTYYHNNLVGSPVAATSSTGALLWTTDYLPYGEKYATDNNASSNKIWFTGHVQDAPANLVYMEARYYDPEVGRFMAIDPAGFTEANPQSFNRYAYANNNPYRYVDENGMWASQKGFWVHQRATYLVIGRYLPKGENAILANAQSYADSSGFQNGESSYRHAMSGPSDTPESARARANDFVRQQFERAWSASTREESLMEFGIALHTLQDSTSPSHGGFQSWSGEETTIEEYNHVRKEMLNPGKGSNLYKVTEDAWKWFQDKKLPEGNLFKHGMD